MRNTTFSRTLEPFKNAKIRIGEDPGYDINEAFDISRFSQLRKEKIRDVFYRNWKRALRGVARLYGLKDVDGFRTTYQSAHEHQSQTEHDLGDGQTVEALLWQAAHDRMNLPAPLSRSRGGRR